MDFVIPAGHRVKKESEKIDKYLDFAWELMKVLEHENDRDTNCRWYAWNSPQRIAKKVRKN